MEITIRELVMRSNFAFPENQEDTNWFNEGRTPEFMQNLLQQLNLGNDESLTAVPSIIQTAQFAEPAIAVTANVGSDIVEIDSANMVVANQQHVQALYALVNPAQITEHCQVDRENLIMSLGTFHKEKQFETREQLEAAITKYHVDCYEFAIKHGDLDSWTIEDNCFPD
ncbi:hypothetical protein [uncultured Draconibacterium sp.]|uniref:hypothetical protein n=1 Tax=uncultured Draconibacterium sp. TaxID=1573823 RepID=UPI0025DEE05A|nr:hypothetical protein [uncultured Draconibacterium sp.]